MTKGNEDKLANRLIPDLIELAKNYNLLVDDKIKVMSDFTCLKVENKFKLYVSFSEVDISIYQKSTFDKSNKNILKHFIFYRDSPSNKDFLNIPFVVLELKSGDIQVDSIRARNEVARKIRKIFPYCTYIFIAENTSKKEETLFRHGKDFNDFFIYRNFLSDKNKKSIIEQFIRPYLDNLKDMNLL